MQRSIRDILFRALHGLSYLYPINDEIWSNKLPILCFHRVHPVYDPLTQPLHPDRFDRMLRVLKRHWKFYGLEDWQNAMRDPRGCVLTFDDALKDFKDYALPLIKAHDIPVALFVPTESIENRKKLYNYRLADLLLYGDANARLRFLGEEFMLGNHDLSAYLRLVKMMGETPNGREAQMDDWFGEFTVSDQLETNPLTWLELEQLKREGVAIENHSHTHSWMERFCEPEINAEVEVSSDLIKKNLFSESRFFAFPMGAYSMQLTAHLAQKQVVGLTTGNQCFMDGDAVMSRYNVSDRTGEELHLRIRGFHLWISTFLDRK